MLLFVTEPGGMPNVKESSLLKLNLEAVLTENYEAVANCCFGHLYRN